MKNAHTKTTAHPNPAGTEVVASLTIQRLSGSPASVHPGSPARDVLRTCSNARAVLDRVTTGGASTPTGPTRVCVSRDTRVGIATRSTSRVNHPRVCTEGDALNWTSSDTNAIVLLVSDMYLE